MLFFFRFFRCCFYSHARKVFFSSQGYFSSHCFCCSQGLIFFPRIIFSFERLIFLSQGFFPRVFFSCQGVASPSCQGVASPSCQGVASPSSHGVVSSFMPRGCLSFFHGVVSFVLRRGCVSFSCQGVLFFLLAK